MTEILRLRGATTHPHHARNDVLVDGARIIGVGDSIPPTRSRDVDVTGLHIVPGFIDIQINGAFGHDFTTDPGSIWQVGEELRRTGVTAFFPTLVSTDMAGIDAARKVVVAGPPSGYRGADVMGLHIEGPFLSPERNGAHNPDVLCDPSPHLVADWSPSTGVAIVTLAPELPGAVATIRRLEANGVVVSSGHSNATFDEAMAGFAAGSTLVTHLFNGMSGMEHRNPGLVAAALAHPEVFVELIPDGHHVHAGAIRAARAAVGDGRIILITDAIAATGQTELMDDRNGEAGPSAIGSMQIASTDGAPRLASGTLAGSLLTMDRAISTYMELAHVDLATAVDAATAVPALALGMKEHGHVIPIVRSRLALLDENHAVVGTVIGEDVRFVSDGPAA